MKKSYKNLLLGVTAMLSLPSAAQLVSTYYFTQYNQPYTAVTGGTVFGSPLNDEEKFVNPASLTGGAVNTGAGFPIGFNFVYNNFTYDRFAVNANGWISLGQSTVTPNAVNIQSANDYNPISANSTAPADLQCRISALSTDLAAQGGSTLRAQTIGAAPNRTLVVQWSNYSEYYVTGQSFNFQIRLCETSNKVSIAYGPFNTGTAGSAQVGLRGQANTNYNNRRVTNALSWATSIAGTTNAQTCIFNGVVVPASGQVFEWVAPTPCSGTPVVSNAVSSYTSVCPSVNVNLSLSAPYGMYTGITYQWQSSSTGVGGTYSDITTGTGSGTTAAIPSATLSVPTAFRAVITCAGGSSVASTPVLVNVGLPVASAAVPNYSTICSGMSATVGLSSAYTGTRYQWQASPTGIPGTFTSVPNATLVTLPTGNLNTTTYYQAVVTCSSAVTASIITSPTNVVVSAATPTNTVPYLETFEGLQANNLLPNCQWMATNLNNFSYTYIAPTGSDNQYNHTPGGSKFASFSYEANDAFFTNEMFLQAGVTYSAGVWYITDGTPGWLEFSLNINTQQVISTNTVIAGVTNITNMSYSLLSGTFTVPSTGIYYISVQGLATVDPYALSFDDLSVTAPCSLNPATFSVTAPSAVCIGNSANLTASSAGLATSASTYTWSSTGLQSNSVSVSPTASTTYTAIGSSTLGCTSERTVRIVVNNLPAVSIYANPSTICEGEYFTQIVQGTANSFTWSSGENTAVLTQSLNTSTDYTVTAKDPNGCVNTATQSIVVNTPPVITATVSKNNICTGESANIAAAGGIDYIWQTSPNSLMTGQSITVSPTVTTTYTVIGVDINGCSAEATVQQKVDLCTGINALSGNTVKASISPNPNNGEFTVMLNNGAAKTIEVMDVTGRVILTSTTAKDAASFNINDFADGIYYIKIQSNNQVEVVKVVKQ